MLFLVSGDVHKSHYMCDGEEIESVIRLVDATDWYEAEKKFSEHYEAMTSDYSVYYSVGNVSSSEIIT